MDETAEQRALRKACEQRLHGCAVIVRRLRVSEDADDIADAAFLLGAINDIADYVGALREVAEWA